MSNASGSGWFVAARWLLAASYGIGAPVTAFVEFERQALSARFGLPAELVYLASLVQLFSVPMLFFPRLAPWAALALTGTTLAAAGAHFASGSPLTAAPAFAFTAVQVWFGLRARGALRAA